MIRPSYRAPLRPIIHALLAVGLLLGVGISVGEIIHVAGKLPAMAEQEARAQIQALIPTPVAQDPIISATSGLFIAGELTLGACPEKHMPAGHTVVPTSGCTTILINSDSTGTLQIDGFSDDPWMTSGRMLVVINSGQGLVALDNESLGAPAEDRIHSTSDEVWLLPGETVALVRVSSISRWSLIR